MLLPLALMASAARSQSSERARRRVERNGFGRVAGDIVSSIIIVLASLCRPPPVCVTPASRRLRAEEAPAWLIGGSLGEEGPDDAGELVGQGDDHHHGRLGGLEPGEPGGVGEALLAPLQALQHA